MEHEPGTFFVYNTAGTYMLSALVQKVTGQRLLDYLGPRLFEPLGIEGATWQQSPDGRRRRRLGMSATTEDIAVFGQLYLQDGVWDGRQVLPDGLGRGGDARAGAQRRRTRTSTGRRGTGTSSGAVATAATAATARSGSTAWCCPSRTSSW